DAPRRADARAILVGIERPGRLAERLADTRARIRAHRDIGSDPAPARIEADRMVGGGKYDAPHLGLPSGLEQVVATDDVRIQNRIPRAFDRVAAEMHNAVHAGDGAF